MRLSMSRHCAAGRPRCCRMRPCTHSRSRFRRDLPRSIAQPTTWGPVRRACCTSAVCGGAVRWGITVQDTQRGAPSAKRRTPLQRCLIHGMPPCATCLQYRQGTRFCCAAGHHEGHCQKPGPCPRQKACALGPPVLPSTPTNSGTARLPSSAPSATAAAVSSSSMQLVGDTQRRSSVSSSPGARRLAREPPPRTRSPGAASPKAPHRRPRAAASDGHWTIKRMNDHHWHSITNDGASVGLLWDPG